MQIKMLETVHYGGFVYRKGEVYHVPTQTAYALGGSCEVIAPPAPPEVKEQRTEEVKKEEEKPRKPRRKGKNKMMTGEQVETKA